MSRRLKVRWLPGLLWALALSTAAALVLLVVFCPFLARDGDDGWARVAGLFARDPAVRRTALASAIGLVVTASVFFRPVRMTAGPRPKSERQPPSSMAGA